MAIAGRSYANVPIIIRNSLQDAPVLTTTPPVIVSIPPDSRWFAVNHTTYIRNTLVDPPVLTTQAPVVIAAATDKRWYAIPQPVILSNPAAPVVASSTTTPGPIVVTSQPPTPKTVQAFITRNTLQDPPVLTTPNPVVIATPNDQRWFAVRQAQIISNSQTAAPVASATPGPVVVNAPYDRRWFNTSPAQIIDNVQLGTIPVFAAAPKPIIVSSSRPAQFLFRQAQIIRNFLVPTGPAPDTRTPLHLSGTVVPLTINGTATVVSINAMAVVSSVYGGNAVVQDATDAALVEWTMQEVDIVLGEFNDVTVALTFVQGSPPSALDISTATINMYLKSAAGMADTDPSTLKLSSAGGSPAITITNGPGGLATVAIPNADLQSVTQYNFYRADAVIAGKQNTAVYGKVSTTAL